MYEVNKLKAAHMPPATTATNATQTMSFDTNGADALNLFVMVGTHATNGAAIGTLKLTESDTVTSPSSQSAIVAFTGGTVTSSSVGFVIPSAATLGGGGVIEFQVDLKGRKRYLGLSITPGSTTFNISALALLGKCAQSGDNTTSKAITNNGATSDAGVALIVAG